MSKPMRTYLKHYKGEWKEYMVFIDTERGLLISPHVDCFHIEYNCSSCKEMSLFPLPKSISDHIHIKSQSDNPLDVPVCRYECGTCDNWCVVNPPDWEGALTTYLNGGNVSF